MGLRLGPSAHQTQVEMLAAPQRQDQTVVAQAEGHVFWQQLLLADQGGSSQSVAAWIASTHVFTPFSLSPVWVRTCQGLFTRQECHREEEFLCNTWILAEQDLHFPLQQEVKVQINFRNNYFF